MFIYRFFREDCLTFEMSSGSAGKDSESGSHFQPGLRRPLQSTQEKLQNGLGMISKFRISSVFCKISNIYIFFCGLNLFYLLYSNSMLYYQLIFKYVLKNENLPRQNIQWHLLHSEMSIFCEWNLLHVGMNQERLAYF